MSSTTNNSKLVMKEIWDRVSGLYSKVGPKYWDYFGSRLASLSDICEGHTVLDIGCGRGASLFPAAKLLGAAGRAYGIDLSDGMVKNTTEDAKLLNLNNVLVMKMDAEKLDFNDEYFDRAINGFGIGYLLDQAYKISEVHRTLKSGGKVCLSLWAQQEDNEWITELVNKYLPQNTPMNSDAPKPPRLDTAEGINEILNHTGFKDIRTHYEEKVFTYRDEDEWWEEMWANAVRGILERIQRDGTERLESFRQEAFNGLQQFKDNQGIHFKRSVIYAVGVK